MVVWNSARLIGHTVDGVGSVYKKIFRTFPGISSEEQCERCLNGFDCSPGRPRKLCPEGTYKKEANFTDEPYQLKFDLEHFEPFDKFLLNDGWAVYECIDCKPGMFCLGLGRFGLLSLRTFYCLTQESEIGSVDVYLKEDNDTIPTNCPTGTYQPESGKSYCIPCNIGTGEYCPEGPGRYKF